MPPGEDSVPEENRFQWKDKKRKPFDPPHSTENGESESATEENAGDEEGAPNGDYEPSEVETEEDELAAMVRSILPRVYQLLTISSEKRWRTILDCNNGPNQMPSLRTSPLHYMVN